MEASPEQELARFSKLSKSMLVWMGRVSCWILVQALEGWLYHDHAIQYNTFIQKKLRSSLLRPLLHAIVSFKIAASYGIEVDPVKCQKAIPFIQLCVAEMASQGLGLSPNSIPKIICKPIEQVRQTCI
jgi:hypothetical protein